MDIPAINNKYIENFSETAKNKSADDSFERRLKSAMDENNKEELKKVCREFEAIMLEMMYKQMKATVPRSDLIPRDAGHEIFESMLDESLAQEASSSGSFGLADILYRQLSMNMDSKFVPAEKGEEAPGDEK